MKYLEFERPFESFDQKIAELERMAHQHNMDLSEEIQGLQQKRAQKIKEVLNGLSAYQRIHLARHPDRPYTLDYIKALITDFYELHGDRGFRDDQALVGGIGSFNNRSVMVIGHQKGRNTRENIARNFGMAHPEGFRKALRLMSMAERFHLPILSFIDSAGAYPGLEAEERGQHEAIARNLLVMSKLQTPIIVTVIGEGGSGGALAIGVGDHISVLENAYYAVCTPEACAAILFKDRAKAEEAVNYMRIMPPDLLKLGVVDEIIPEPLGGAHRDWKVTAQKVGENIERQLQTLEKIDGELLIEQRYKKFRQMGQFLEESSVQAAAEIA